MSACNVWFYQRVDLLHFDIVHILERAVELYKLSEYLYTDMLCDWILEGLQDKDISCYQTLNNHRIQISVCGHRTDHRTDHKTDCWIQWTNLTVSYSGQVRLVSLLYHCMCY